MYCIVLLCQLLLLSVVELLPDVGFNLWWVFDFKVNGRENLEEEGCDNVLSNIMLSLRMHLCENIYVDDDG